MGLTSLLVLTMVLFGIDTADGPLQVALFLSATFAALVACTNGHTASAIEEAAMGGVSSPSVRSSSCWRSGP